MLCVLYMFIDLYTLYKSLIAGLGSSFGRGKGRLRKHGLPPHTRAPPTSFTALASTIPTTATTFTPPSHPPHTQEFVMIPNPRYM